MLTLMEEYELHAKNMNEIYGQTLANTDYEFDVYIKLCKLGLSETALIAYHKEYLYYKLVKIWSAATQEEDRKMGI